MSAVTLEESKPAVPGDRTYVTPREEFEQRIGVDGNPSWLSPNYILYLP